MTTIATEELHALTQRIINSGVLGRSKTYGAILKYLVECSLKGETPKEAAIAVDVLGREGDFDVSKDSIVRVHIYHLRNKLSNFYERLGREETHRIDIPKGQYTIVVRPNVAEPTRDSEMQREATGKQAYPYLPWAVGIIVFILGFLLYLNLDDARTPSASSLETANFVPSALAQQPWLAILDDDLPILLVIGDYYIFGELDEQGNVARMVREFNINSPEDLDRFQREVPENAGDFYNLDLSYIPVSVASAMAHIMPMLQTKSSRVEVKLMSDMETADLASSHIIYIGYLSAVDTLLDLMFADSGLSIGSTYDELINLDTNEYYVGSSGLSGDESFRDYGLVTTFPAPNGNQFLLIAGMRDEGLTNVSRQITTLSDMESLQMTLGSEGMDHFEALYEVVGFDNTNFGGQLVYSRSLDTKVIWETRLISQ